MLEDREFDTDQGSLPSPIIGNWLEARQEIQAGLHGALLRQRKREQKQLPLFTGPRGRCAGSFHGVRLEACPGVRLEGWLRWFAHPLGTRSLLLLHTPWLCSRLFGGSSWASLVFSCLLSRICLNCACMQLFLVPYSFFVFCCLRRCLPRCKHHSTAAKGPGPCLSQFYNVVFFVVVAAV